MNTTPSGILSTKVLPLGGQYIPKRALTLREFIHFGFPYLDLPREVLTWRRHNLPHLWRGLWRVAIARACGIPHLYGQLAIAIVGPEGRVDYGLASLRVVTNKGANYLVQSLRGLQTASNMRYHGFGSGGTIESATQETLVTEFSSEYQAANIRNSGSLEYGTDSGGTVLENVFRTIATTSFSTGVSINEHGIFSQASRTSGTPAGGYLLDRSVFTTQNVMAGFAIETQYDFTINAGA